MWHRKYILYLAVGLACVLLLMTVFQVTDFEPNQSFSHYLPRIVSSALSNPTDSHLSEQRAIMKERSSDASVKTGIVSSSKREPSQHNGITEERLTGSQGLGEPLKDSSLVARHDDGKDNLDMDVRIGES